MLEQFSAELPDKQTLKHMSQDAAEAILNILEAAIYIDRRVTPEELATLQEELRLLPVRNIPKVLLNYDEYHFFQYEQSGVQYDPQKLEENLSRWAKDIETDLDRQTCVRLLAILCCSEASPDTRNINYFHQVVDALGYDQDTANNILRSAHDSRLSN